MTQRVLEPFSCGGGASLGMSLLGFEVVGIDHDPDACATHTAAGHQTIQHDLRLPFTVPAGPWDGCWLSPPCTAFSAAGKGEGRELADQLVAAIDAEDWSPWYGPAVAPEVWLVLSGMKIALDAAPRWVAMENVPATKPVMDACARVLERHGYRCRVLVLSAEQFGVAQTRKRCFLMANRDRVPEAPEPTHQAYRYGEPAQAEESLFGTIKPWVSMAESLQWPTDVSIAQWRGAGMVELYGERPDRPATEPAFNIGSGVQRQIVVLDRRTVSRGPGGTKVPTVAVPISSPSPSLTSSGVDGQFVWRSAAWPCERPATTVNADRRLSDPGHHDPNQSGSQYSEDTIRLTAGEAARLQAFPVDYPWRGTKTSVFRQIGNAVAVPMGAVVAGAAAGIDWHAPVADYLADLYTTPIPYTDAELAERVA